MANLSDNPEFKKESESKIDPDKSRALDLFSELLVAFMNFLVFQTSNVQFLCADLLQPI